ncbi:MAG: nitroreductase [Candidatus Saccharibacteria bacterium]|nr:nitroreductase [Pseudorhodobacter sp.]
MLKPNPAAVTFLSQRRSRPAKLFKGPVPDRSQLRAILTSALRVPDHGKLEPWRLIVLDRAAMQHLADLAEARAVELGYGAQKIGKGRGQFDQGQLAVAVISSPKGDLKPVLEQVASAAALCMNLLNAAEAAGWGANWLTGWPAHDPQFVARAFGCQAGETVVGIVHIGTPPEDGADRPRPDIDRVTTWPEDQAPA